MRIGFTHFQTSMANRDSTPPLLAIPLELREQIFKEVLSSAHHGTELLRTCAEIKREAHKYLFQRNITFRGQTSLYAWIEDVPPEYLHHVTQITIELHEPDLSPLLAPVVSSCSTVVAPRLMTVELHEKDLQRLLGSLGKLQNIKVLTIRTLLGRLSHLYRKFVSDFLDALSSLWPELQDLILEGNIQSKSLSFLATLPELQSFTFDGFSASSLKDMTAIFAQLEHLDSLSLALQHNQRSPTRSAHGGFVQERQSFTDTVLHSMTGLVSFSVTERLHPTSPAALFLTPKLLEALSSIETLRSLTLDISQAPNGATLMALDHLLANTKIERIELDWPYLDPRVFEEYALLPVSLKELWVRVPSPGAAFDMLYIIQDSIEAGEMSALKKVVLIREVWSDVAPGKEDQDDEVDTQENIDEGFEEEDEEPAAHDDDDNDPAADATDEQNVARTMRLLGHHGVKVLWRTEG